MRPSVGLDNGDPRPRKPSLTESPSIPGERPNLTPTTFFLTRESDSSRLSSERQSSSSPTLASSSSPPVSTLQDLIQEAERPSKQTACLPGQPRSGSRRRSTIKPGTNIPLQRRSSSGSNEHSMPARQRDVTPSPIPSRDISLPASPKSASSKSVQRSDDELTIDDTGSQAVASSDEDDQDESPAKVQDSQPELIMPSIKMPSRRPFTSRGKQLGRFKILVAGRKGVGKSSLIKSIVQVCEDIVHVDPLSPSSTLHSSQRDLKGSHGQVSEIYASTKPYPAWWSNIEESRILKRRKSLGDSVLERNLCFVDTPDSSKLDKIVHYVEQQLVNAMVSVEQLGSELSGLLSGRGSSHVDVILYLISKDNLKDDCYQVQQLSELCNVIPLVARSDLLSPEEQASVKEAIDAGLASLPRVPMIFGVGVEQKTEATAPYTVTSVNGPDLDTMDASLLMSPEYIQPLLPSELGVLIQQLFEPETVAYLRHTAAKKLIAWHAAHPKLTSISSPSLRSVHNSTLASPIQTSLSNSGLLLPLGSEVSLNTSNSWALAKLADHTQREERIAQVRLSKWAGELQLSLQRERERYERMARGERAIWLVERMGEEIRDGKIVTPEIQQALVHKGSRMAMGYGDVPTYQMHDPLGLLRWQDSMRTRGWIALQVVGSFGVVGGLAFWLAKTWGFTMTINDWAQGIHGSWFGDE